MSKKTFREFVGEGIVDKNYHDKAKEYHQRQAKNYGKRGNSKASLAHQRAADAHADASKALRMIKTVGPEYSATTSLKAVKRSERAEYVSHLKV